MKLNSLGAPTQHTPFTRKIAFSVDSTTSKGFRLLTKDLYVKKGQSMVRELVSNAIDAIRSNPQTRPGQVAIRLKNNVLTISDNGCGMSIDELESVYTVLFKSPKDVDNADLGAYGLGAKIPLSYGTEQLQVTTVKDGQKITAIAFVDVDPQLGIISEEPTIEQSGTTVSIELAGEEQDIIRTAIHLALYNPDVISLEDEKGNVLANNKIQVSRVEKEGFVFFGMKADTTHRQQLTSYVTDRHGIIVFCGNKTYKFSDVLEDAFSAHAKSTILIDGRIPYVTSRIEQFGEFTDISYQIVKQSSRDEYQQLATFVTPIVPIGSVEMNLSRESITVDEISSDVQKVLDSAVENYKAGIADTYRTAMETNGLLEDQLKSIDLAKSVNNFYDLAKRNMAWDYRNTLPTAKYRKTVVRFLQHTKVPIGNGIDIVQTHGSDRYRISLPDGMLSAINRYNHTNMVNEGFRTEICPSLFRDMASINDKGAMVAVFDMESKKHLSVTQYAGKNKLHKVLKVAVCTTWPKKERNALLLKYFNALSAVLKVYGVKCLLTTDFDEVRGKADKKTPGTRVYKYDPDTHWKYIETTPPTSKDIVLYCSPCGNYISADKERARDRIGKLFSSMSRSFGKQASRLVYFQKLAQFHGIVEKDSRILVVSTAKDSKYLENHEGRNVGEVATALYNHFAKKYPTAIAHSRAWHHFTQWKDRVLPTRTDQKPLDYVASVHDSFLDDLNGIHELGERIEDLLTFAADIPAHAQSLVPPSRHCGVNVSNEEQNEFISAIIRDISGDNVKYFVDKMKAQFMAEVSQQIEEQLKGISV